MSNQPNLRCRNCWRPYAMLVVLLLSCGPADPRMTPFSLEERLWFMWFGGFFIGIAFSIVVRFVYVHAKDYIRLVKLEDAARAERTKTT